MRKYKLKCKYPGSPNIGDAVTYDDTIHAFRVANDYFQPLPVKSIRDYPEFWEPVIEKEFEILEVSYKDKIYNRFDGCFWYDKSYRIISDITGRIHTTSLHMVIIIKIKRLSDNVEFSIGDLCYPESKPLNCGKITELEYCKAGSFRIGCKGKYYIGINNVVKAKEPLFTTFDGKDIYPGNTYWCVNTSPYLWSLFEQTSKERTQLNKTVIAFSTKELAEEYIDNNKPIYSKNQIDSTMSKCYISTSMGNFIKEDSFKQHLNLKL